MSVLPLIDSCPKRMEYGPCGGVGFDGSCEVDAAHRCAFVHRPTVPWSGLDRTTAVGPGPRTAAATATLAALGTRPWIVADLPARALSVASIDGCAAILTGEVDAVLAGDAGSARVQFPPAYRAHLLQRRGLRVWTGLNMRDRNRVAIEGELAALAVEGVAGVHCVTGDHTRTGHRPDAAPVFDLDSTEATALARAAGHVVSVAASPAAPPVDRRAARLREKQRAGADVCFVNHAGGGRAGAPFHRRGGRRHPLHPVRTGGRGSRRRICSSRSPRWCCRTVSSPVCAGPAIRAPRESPWRWRWRWRCWRFPASWA